MWGWRPFSPGGPLPPHMLCLPPLLTLTFDPASSNLSISPNCIFLALSGYLAPSLVLVSLGLSLWLPSPGSHRGGVAMRGAAASPDPKISPGSHILLGLIFYLSVLPVFSALSPLPKAPLHFPSPRAARTPTAQSLIPLPPLPVTSPAWGADRDDWKQAPAGSWKGVGGGGPLSNASC